MKYFLFVLFICAAMHSCKSVQNINVAQGPSSTNETKEIQELKIMQEKGIDFYAEGNIPVKWSLQMNYDDTIRFNAEDGIFLKYAYNKLKKDINPERSLLSASVSGGDMKITVYEKPCELTANTVSYKKVTFSFINRNYTGCGKYLADKMLNNKWLLEKIGNTLINSSEYNRIPVFNMDLSKGRIIGNDGCNSLSGQIEVQGKRIKFSSIARTEMGCPKKDISNIISAQISDKLVDYYFKDGKLYLYLPDDSLLVFKKG